jgi:hypothetical protein
MRTDSEVDGVAIIGELAPLLSVLGHQMHKRHKSAATSIWTCRPIWMCVAALSVRLRYLSAPFLISFSVTTATFE